MTHPARFVIICTAWENWPWERDVYSVFVFGHVFTSFSSCVSHSMNYLISVFQGKRALAFDKNIQQLRSSLKRKRQSSPPIPSRHLRMHLPADSLKRPRKVVCSRFSHQCSIRRMSLRTASGRRRNSGSIALTQPCPTLGCPRGTPRRVTTENEMVAVGPRGGSEFLTDQLLLSRSSRWWSPGAKGLANVSNLTVSHLAAIPPTRRTSSWSGLCGAGVVLQVLQRSVSLSHPVRLSLVSLSYR